jgi:hypothetical protein
LKNSAKSLEKNAENRRKNNEKQLYSKGSHLMKEYFVTVITVAAVFGGLSMLSYRGGSVERAVIGIISLFLLISPMAKAASDVDFEKIRLPSLSEEWEGEELSAYAEEAFCRGITLAICEEFSLSAEDISVRSFGFDYEKMSAEKIRVILSGRAAFASSRAVESFVNKMKIGECRVEVEIG